MAVFIDLSGYDYDEPSQSKYWQSVKGPDIFPDEEEVRGSFHLAVLPHKLEYVWNKVQKRTIRGQLGYMSSLSPGPMTWGRLEGSYTISIHTLHEDKEQTMEQLEYWNLFKYAFKYNVIKKFRDEFWDEEEYY